VNDALTRQVTIVNARGLHARAAAKFVETVRGFDANVQVTRDGETVSADSIMELLMLAASKGSSIQIQSDGNQAREALDQLVELVEAGFYEED
jgi:phosphocarrier protein HPr